MAADQFLEIDDPAARSLIESWVEGVNLDYRFVYYLLGATGICVVPISSFCSQLHGFRITALEERPGPDEEHDPAIGASDQTLPGLVALQSFAGCAVIISHDRWFLDGIATHILAFEGDSRVVWFEGNYQAYEEDHRRRLGEAVAQPHRIKYFR